MAHEVIVLGNSINSIVAQRIFSENYDVVRIGMGENENRFLILNQTSIIMLERYYKNLPLHFLKGIKVFDRNCRMYHTVNVKSYGFKIASANYKILLSDIRNQTKGKFVEAYVRSIETDGKVDTDKGIFKAERFVLSTFSTKGGGIKFTHRKPFLLTFVRNNLCDDWIYQINDRGYYAVIVPMGKFISIAFTKGTEKLLKNCFGIQIQSEKLKRLKLISFWKPKYVDGKVIYIGEAVRRFHPHTAQGLNRALKTLSYVPNIPKSESFKDLFLFTAGIILDSIWGNSKYLSRLTYKLISNKLFWKVFSVFTLYLFNLFQKGI